jgi:glutamine amidotransferase
MKSTRIAIIDYGMGNLQSVRNALERVGCEVQITSELATLRSADALVLPGVGAFGEAMINLQQRKLVDPVRSLVLEEGKPLLGICLGMQLLADSSEERGTNRGLSLIPGHVKEIPVSGRLRLPHIGWNGVSVRKRDPLFGDIEEQGAFYFVHSYCFECEPEHIAGVTDYGSDVTAAVQKERIFGVQFHPERSQRKGLRLLRNFVDFVDSTVGNG